MSKAKAAKAKHAIYFRLVGLLLLCIFAGRVALVSVYGYAGIPKASTGICAQDNEQEDNDKKEESKYTEKQFKCFAPIGYAAPVIAILFAPKALPKLSAANFYNTFFLTVPTPPPNC